MNFGGPVWHASVAKAGLAFPRKLEDMARRALEGVGDASLGEWREQRPDGRCVHVRRRLSTAEAKLIRDPRDIRGTVEESERLAAVMRFLPPGWSG